MTQRPGWRPEHTLILAILVLTAALLVAVILVMSGLAGGGRAEAMVPYGAALVVAGGVAAYLINYFGKKAARKQRPEWLETQAWRRGLIEKLQQGQPGGGAPPGGAPGEPGSKGDSSPRKG